MFHVYFVVVAVAVLIFAFPMFTTYYYTKISYFILLISNNDPTIRSTYKLSIRETKSGIEIQG